MYVAVRRYEGVTDPKKVAQLGEEGFVPIISEMPGFVAHYLVDFPHGYSPINPRFASRSIRL